MDLTSDITPISKESKQSQLHHYPILQYIFQLTLNRNIPDWFTILYLENTQLLSMIN